MKKFLGLSALVLLIPSLSFSGPALTGRGARSTKRLFYSPGRGLYIGTSGSQNRSFLNSHYGASRGMGARAVFRSTSGRGVGTDTGGGTGGGTGGTTTTTQAAPPTYSMIGATIHSPGMFSTQVPINETRGFQYTDAGGVKYQQAAVNQDVSYGRGTFTDTTLSGGAASGGYGSLFASH